MKTFNEVHPKVNYFPAGNNIMKENHTCKYSPYHSKPNGVGFTLNNFTIRNVY